MIPFSERLLKDFSLIDQAKALGLIVFCWGDDNNNTDNIKKLKDKGVDGVIYDRFVSFTYSSGQVHVYHNETAPFQASYSISIGPAIYKLLWDLGLPTWV